jgi:hypothetical protein
MHDYLVFVSRIIDYMSSDGIAPSLLMSVAGNDLEVTTCRAHHQVCCASTIGRTHTARHDKYCMYHSTILMPQPENDPLVD